jgi:hypothetical protein
MVAMVVLYGRGIMHTRLRVHGVLAGGVEECGE